MCTKTPPSLPELQTVALGSLIKTGELCCAYMTKVMLLLLHWQGGHCNKLCLLSLVDTWLINFDLARHGLQPGGGRNKST